MRSIFIITIILFLLTACGAAAQPAAPTAAWTAAISPTNTLVPTETPTSTPTESPAPAESDLRPAYTETIAGELLGVKITTNLITDESLDPIITAIKINDHYTNSEGKNSKDALTEFTARTFYKVWLKKGGVDGTGTKTDVTFEEYMAMWAEAQASGREEDWREVQITIKANDIATEGYEPIPTTIWFGYTGVAPEGVRAIDEFDIAFIKGNKVKNIDIVEINYNIGLGTNIADKNLVMYLGITTFKDATHVGNVVPNMSAISGWMSNQSLSVDKEINGIIATRANTSNKNIYSAIIQIFPQVSIEKQYNP